MVIPLCAVCIPSRGRPNGLIKTVLSVLNSVDYSDNLEIVVRLDEDDQKIKPRLDELVILPHIKCIYGPRYDAYNSLGLFYTECAAATKANWIMLLGDDCTVQGKGWDSQLAKFPLTGVFAYPEIDMNGFSGYRFYNGGPHLWVPNKCWEVAEGDKLSNPVDVFLYNFLMGMRWEYRFLMGVTVVHDRKGAGVEEL